MSNHDLGRAIIELGRGKYDKFDRNQRARKNRRWKVDEEGEWYPTVPKTHGELRDNLNPLRRWLERHVGKSWAKTYAEFCKKVDRRSLQGDHIHRHLRDMVHGSGGKESMGYYSEYTPPCRIELHGYDRFFLDKNGILRQHESEKECEAYSKKVYGWKRPEVEKMSYKPYTPKPVPKKPTPEEFDAYMRHRKLEENRRDNVRVV